MTNKQQLADYFEKHHTEVYRYILAKVRNPQLAEDMMMEVFGICCGKIDSYDPAKAQMRTWVYCIANNKLKNYYRDKKQLEDIDECTEYISGFEDEVIAAQYLQGMRNSLADALETLNEMQRKIVILKYFKDKTAPEISRIMGMSAVNVRVNLSRGIAKLKAYFKENNIEWED